jgi:quercetin dioxygenase-like cupin family protein
MLQKLRFFQKPLLQGGVMKALVASHAVTAVLASVVTYCVFVDLPDGVSFLRAHAQTPAPAPGTRQIELFKTTMNDVMGRVVTIRRTERDAGSGTAPHRHPGSHTFGYVLEGTYEIKIDDGPVRRLGAGETFYEAPGQLHAVSRNGSTKEVVKYLVIQVSDPTKPQTVME